MTFSVRATQHPPSRRPPDWHRTTSRTRAETGYGLLSSHDGRGRAQQALSMPASSARSTPDRMRSRTVA